VLAKPFNIPQTWTLSRLKRDKSEQQSLNQGQNAESPNLEIPNPERKTIYHPDQAPQLHSPDLLVRIDTGNAKVRLIGANISASALNRT
jgi:hypothetical protein